MSVRQFNTDKASDIFWPAFIWTTVLIAWCALVAWWVWSNLQPVNTCAEAIKLCAGSRGLYCDETERLCETKK